MHAHVWNPRPRLLFGIRLHAMQKRVHQVLLGRVGQMRRSWTRPAVRSPTPSTSWQANCAERAYVCFVVCLLNVRHWSRLAVFQFPGPSIFHKRSPRFRGGNLKFALGFPFDRGELEENITLAEEDVKMKAPTWNCRCMVSLIDIIYESDCWRTTAILACLSILGMVIQHFSRDFTATVRFRVP